MWQTARPAPAMIAVLRRRASIVFSLDGRDGLCTCAVISGQQSRQKATSGCEGTGPLEPKQDSAPSQRSRERRCAPRWQAAWVVRVGVAETTRRPCGPRFGLQVGRPSRLAACAQAIFACVTSGRREGDAQEARGKDSALRLAWCLSG